MKKKVLAGILILMSSGSVLAGNEGPSADPTSTPVYTYRCNETASGKLKYKLEYSPRFETAVISLNKGLGRVPRFVPIYAHARAIQAADGGPLMIIGKDESPTDWSNAGCYVVKQPEYQFTLRLSSRGIKGHLQVIPTVDQRPGSLCPVPELELPPVEELSCIEN